MFLNDQYTCIMDGCFIHCLFLVNIGLKKERKKLWHSFISFTVLALNYVIKDYLRQLKALFTLLSIHSEIPKTACCFSFLIV